MLRSMFVEEVSARQSRNWEIMLWKGKSPVLIQIKNVTSNRKCEEQLSERRFPSNTRFLFRVFATRNILEGTSRVVCKGGKSR